METLRGLETKSLNADLYKSELDKHMGEEPLYTPSNHSLEVIIGTVALILGFVIGHATQ
jgi:hypothetical protein